MKGCQTCLKVIDYNKPIFYLNDTYMNPDKSSSSNNQITIKEQLSECVPELLLDSVENAVMCESCINVLKVAYEFRQKCLETQERVYGYLQQMPIDTKIDMNEIAMHYNRLDVIANGENPFDIEVKIETSTSATVSKPAVQSSEEKPSNRSLQPLSHPISVCDPSTETKIIRCADCSAMYYNKLDYREHVELTRHFTLQCHKCEFKTKKAAELKWHKKHSHGKRKTYLYACSSCNFRGQYLVSLTAHINAKHKMNINKIISTLDCA